ncbi:MAG: glycosyltransferase [Fimbriimonadaceae bacterium]|nr:glycosyltransferase [Fimbriimonadaceae bacterium]
MPVERLRSVAILPAYNEASRIQPVLHAVRQSGRFDRITVVCDGCEDHTAQAARTVVGVEVIELPVNRGKAAAMAIGLQLDSAELVTFIDADLRGLRAEHLHQLVEPVASGQCDMTVGVFRGGHLWSDAAHHVAPFLSGQRTLRRELFERIGAVDSMRMGVEVALNEAARRGAARVQHVRLRGISNCHKEQKLGLRRGVMERLRMYREIAHTWREVRRGLSIDPLP